MFLEQFYLGCVSQASYMGAATARLRERTGCAAELTNVTGGMGAWIEAGLLVTVPAQ